MRARDVFIRLNPLVAIFGPVFDKEVRTLGRVRMTYVSRCLYPAFLTAALAITWFAVTAENASRSPAGRMQMTSNLAPVMAIVFGWVQLGLLTLLAPTLTAPSLCDERQKRTLPSLATTPLTTVQIVFGKLAGRMVQIVILALIAAPLLLLLRIFGGLEAEPVAAIMCLSISTALFSGSLGLAFALWRRRPTGAIGMAVFVLLFYLIFPMPLYFLLSRLGAAPREDVYLLTVAQINPVMAMAAVTAETVQGQFPGPVSVTQVWMVCSGVMLGLATFVGGVASMAMRRVMLAEAAGARPRGKRTWLGKRRSADEAWAGAGADRSRKSRRVGANPVLWREARARFFRSRRGAVAVGALIALGIGALYLTADLDSDALHLTVSVVICVGQLLIASQWTARSLAGEREAQTWDTLLTTRLTGRQILYGKWLGATIRLLPLPVFLLLHYAVFGAIGYTHFVGGILIACVLVGCTLLLAATGIRVSMMVKRSATAGTANAGIGLVLWLVAPIVVPLLFMIVYQGGNSDAAESAVRTALAINPVFWTFQISIWAHQQAIWADGAFFGLADRAFAMDPMASMSPGEIVVAMVGFAVAVSLIGLLVMEWSVRRFRKGGGRTS